MTREEALTVTAIALTADGNCPYCADDLLEELARHFPRIDWKALATEVRSSDD